MVAGDGAEISPRFVVVSLPGVTAAKSSAPHSTLPAYDLVGLRVGLVGKQLSGFVFADNVTNKHADLGINTTGFSWTTPSVERVVTNRPRTIGLDIKYSF